MRIGRIDINTRRMSSSILFYEKFHIYLDKIFRYPPIKNVKNKIVPRGTSF